MGFHQPMRLTKPVSSTDLTLGSHVVRLPGHDKSVPLWSWVVFGRVKSTKLLQPLNGILWSSDEAHFHISGTVNIQHFRYNHQYEFERSLQSNVLQVGKYL